MGAVGANTFPTRNRSQTRNQVFVDWPYPCFSLIFRSFLRKLWWRLPYFENLLIFLSVGPVVTLVATSVKEYLPYLENNVSE